MMSCSEKIRNERKHIKKSCAIKAVVCCVPDACADSWSHTPTMMSLHTHPLLPGFCCTLLFPNESKVWNCRETSLHTLMMKLHPTFTDLKTHSHVKNPQLSSSAGLQRLQRMNQPRTWSLHLQPRCLPRLPWPQLNARLIPPSAERPTLTPCLHRSFDLK